VAKNVITSAELGRSSFMPPFPLSRRSVEPRPVELENYRAREAPRAGTGGATRDEMHLTTPAPARIKCPRGRPAVFRSSANFRSSAKHFRDMTNG
jgi:hypothetical protein